MSEASILLSEQIHDGEVIQDFITNSRLSEGDVFQNQNGIAEGNYSQNIGTVFKNVTTR